jgi:hypothetical protein
MYLTLYSKKFVLHTKIEDHGKAMGVKLSGCHFCDQPTTIYFQHAEEKLENLLCYVIMTVNTVIVIIVRSYSYNLNYISLASIRLMSINSTGSVTTKTSDTELLATYLEVLLGRRPPTLRYFMGPSRQMPRGYRKLDHGPSLAHPVKFIFKSNRSQQHHSMLLNLTSQMNVDKNQDSVR